MTTKPRKRSASGFYHVFQRGVNHYDIFEGDDDRERYIELMTKCARKYKVELHAWCLMSNHTHLLLRASRERLSAMMRQLGSEYARFFNARHGRTGALFGSRFESVCVETDAQLVAVVRYIHRNPVEHDEHCLFGDYPWSSYGEYLAGCPESCRLDFALELFGGLDEFIRVHESRLDSERQLDIGTAGAMRDDEARWRANDVLRHMGARVSISAIGTLPREARDRGIAVVVRSIRCSCRQMQRLTSVAYSVILSAVRRVDVSSIFQGSPLPALE